MADDRLRVGIIGMGWWAATNHVPHLRATGRAEVVAAARRNAERLALAQHQLNLPAVYTDWRAMLAETELDAVVVSTPHDQHVEPTLAALERGLHVLLEKPLATTVADAQTILRAAQQSDRVVMMGVNARGDPRWQTAQRLLASGQIGRLRQVSLVMSEDLRIFREPIPMAEGLLSWLDNISEMERAFTLDVPRPGAWRRDSEHMGGDMFADRGAHLVDILFWLSGGIPTEVMAYSPPDRPRQAAILNLLGLLSNGVTLSITYNDHVAMGDDFSFRGYGQLTALGDGGTLSVSLPLDAGTDRMLIERNGAREAVTFEGKGRSPAEAFVATILDGAPNVGTVEDAAQVVAFTQGAYQSAADRRLVRLDGAS
jgi:predicted dehydrogenase